MTTLATLRRTKPEHPIYTIEIDRARVAGPAAPDDALTIVEYYITANVEQRHPDRPTIRKAYREALTDCDTPQPIPQTLIERAWSIETDIPGEFSWLEQVMRMLAVYDEGLDIWDWDPRIEDIDIAWSPYAKKNVAERELDTKRILDSLGIKARFSGNYRHDGARCARDGSCCASFDPAPSLPEPPECLPTRTHSYHSPFGLTHYSLGGRRGFSLLEICLICGVQKRSGSSLGGFASSISYDSTRQVMPVGITMGPTVVITGGPGVAMNHPDPPTAFSVLANRLPLERTIVTPDERDVSDLRCQRCGQWIGDTEDPAIAHVSTSHAPECPEPTD